MTVGLYPHRTKPPVEFQSYFFLCEQRGRWEAPPGTIYYWQSQRLTEHRLQQFGHALDRIALMPGLDVVKFASINMGWVDWNRMKLKLNVILIYVKHMWIEVNPTTSNKAWGGAIGNSTRSRGESVLVKVNPQAACSRQARRNRSISMDGWWPGKTLNIMPCFHRCWAPTMCFFVVHVFTSVILRFTTVETFYVSVGLGLISTSTMHPVCKNGVDSSLFVQYLHLVFFYFIFFRERSLTRPTLEA